MFEFYGSQETPVVISKSIGTFHRQGDILKVVFCNNIYFGADL